MHLANKTYRTKTGHMGMLTILILGASPNKHGTHTGNTWDAHKTHAGHTTQIGHKRDTYRTHSKHATYTGHTQHRTQTGHTTRDICGTHGTYTYMGHMQQT